jgi:hypothetical protein
MIRDSRKKFACDIHALYDQAGVCYNLWIVAFD